MARRGGGPEAARRCEVCKLPGARCACGSLPRARPRTRVIVIRQARERKVCGNTGGLVGHVLLGSALLSHGDPAAPLDPAPLADRGLDLRVLFPSAGARVLSPADRSSPDGRPIGLVVLDATWSQARKMAQRIPALRGLPFVRLPDGAAPRLVLRKPPEAGRLGTAEAVATALEILGDGEAAGALRAALATIAESVLRMRGKLPTRKRRRPHEPRANRRTP